MSARKLWLGVSMGAALAGAGCDAGEASTPSRITSVNVPASSGEEAPESAPEGTTSDNERESDAPASSGEPEGSPSASATTDEGGDEVPARETSENDLGLCAPDLRPATFEVSPDALSCDGEKFVRFVQTQNLWAGVVDCGDGSARFYLSDSEEGPFLPALDVAGHGQDSCELVRPDFFLPNSDDITSGGCTGCSIGFNLPLEGVSGYYRAFSGQQYRFVAETGPWSYQVGRVDCGCDGGPLAPEAPTAAENATAGEPREDAPAREESPSEPSSSGAGPRISALQVPPAVEAGGLLEVTWRVTSPNELGVLDDGPGTWMFVGGPSGWVSWCDFPTRATRVSGDANDGVYLATCEVPATTPNAVYGFQVYAYDAFGNPSPDDGLSGETQVVGGSADVSVPVLSSFEVLTPVVAPGEEIVFRIEASDETGIEFLMPWAIGPNGGFASPAGGLWADGLPAVLISGDASNGIWEARLRLIDDAAVGTYSFSVSVSDVVGNRNHEWLGDRSPRVEVTAPR